MKERILKRFVIGMAILTVGAFIFWDLIGDFINRPPGDYHTEVGDLRLRDGLYDEAMQEFDKALEQSPDHRGALMGRSLVFIQTERYGEALAELDYLIGHLERTLEQEPDDVTGRGALAAAFANRGIVHDRGGRYQEALDDYISALKVDAVAVDGPDLFQKLLYAGDQVSTVQKRARYLYEQLQLPEEERLMRVPDLDAQQRMYKP
jgi:tetratricopeptide (TPR) repeat protein